MIKITCDICGEEMAINHMGYEIRSMTRTGTPAMRHMCAECFKRLVLRKEGQEDV